MDDQQKIEQLLTAIPYAVLAVTLDDGTPWAVPVRLRRADNREFEWDSRLDTLHSQAIAVRPQMALTVFEKREDSQVGLYAVGHAELLEEFKPGFGRYRFTAENAWINDETFVKRKVELG